MHAAQLVVTRTIAVSLSLALAACGGGDSTTPNDPVASVTISPATSQLTSLAENVQLSAAVRTQGGASSNATATWQSSAPQVATVDANGLVRAVANGNAQITAAVGTVSGTADVTVQQVAARVTVTPTRDSMFTGATLQLSASATDRSNTTIASPRATWSSSDTSVATVSSSGLVSGRKRGQARITARVDTASGGTDIIVRLTSIFASRDTVLTGTLQVDRFEVAAGRTVTLAGDLSLRAEGPVVINGTIRGNCRAVDIVTLGTLLLRGTVDNTCSDNLATGKRLRLVSGADYNLDSASVFSNGGIVITNDTTQVPASSSLGASPLSQRRALSAAPANCSLNGAIGLGVQRAPGASGDPDGKHGPPANPIHVWCSGDLTVRGATLKGDHGGDGGDGTTTTSGKFAIGGSGGDGASIILQADGRLIVDGSALFPGNGGKGGYSSSIPSTPGLASAAGGLGGDLGSVVLQAPQIVFQGNQTRIAYGRGGDGGDALAVAVAGADATITQPAQQGSVARAVGLDGGQLRRGLRVNVLGDVLVGQVQNPGAVVFQSPTGGKGGTPDVSPGNGGNSAILGFPHGAKGGDGTIEPGSGGNIKLFDNRPGFGFPLGTPGASGDGKVERGNGGFGIPDCVLPFHLGGDGGEGSTVSHLPAGPGKDALDRPGPGVGTTQVIDALNGRDGRPGVPPGAGGKSGVLNAVGGPVLPDVDVGNSRHRGVSGNNCPPLSTSAAVTFETGDPSHVNFLQLQLTTNLIMTFGASAAATSQSSSRGASHAAGATVTVAGNQRWQPFTGPIDDAGNIDVTFNGTFAGRPNIPARFIGKITTASGGLPTGIDGTIEVGLNGTLPGGRSTTYRVKGGT